ncbi:MAG: hypothetical protein ACK4NP_03290 [Parvularculaceae bacterium]
MGANMSIWTLTRGALALAVSILLGAAPARAQGGDYCAETFDRTLGLGRTADDPVGDCRLFEEFRIRHSGGVTSVRLMHDSGANSRERALAMRPQLITVIEAVEARMRSLGAVTLPRTVTITAVSHRHSAVANARTSSQFFRRLSASNDCPIVIYPSREISAGAQRRILAHELFHCIQFDTWPEQTRDEEGTAWWREGSAEWFEDFALPGDWEDSSLPQSVGLFEENCETKALHEQRYANIVLFGWLHQQGLPRLINFIGALARDGEAAEDGLRRAMTAAEYNRFAQDYVEDRIVLPSGWRVVGSRRPLTPAGTTTGEPDADPDIERPVRKAFTIVRQKVEFAPGEYAPDGKMGEENPCSPRRQAAGRRCQSASWSLAASGRSSASSACRSRPRRPRSRSSRARTRPSSAANAARPAARCGAPAASSAAGVRFGGPIVPGSRRWPRWKA